MARTQAADHYAAIAQRRAERPFIVRLASGIWNFSRRKPLGAIGAAIVLIFVFVAVTAPVIAPFDDGAQHLRDKLQGPSAKYRLGTDNLGRDVLSRLMYGAQLSLIVGFGAVGISSLAATLMGLVMAYFGRWVDQIMSRVIDAWIALPDLIILITFLGIVRRTGANMILAMVLGLAFLRSATASRVVRSAVLELRNRPFVEAAEAAGAGPVRIMFRHVLPNILPLIIVTASVALPNAILAEASLSFLGFGPEGTSSWGQMLSVEGREFFRKQPGLALWPGVCIALAVFGFNMFGDALRDVLDPRLRGTRR
ncbi:MAG: ABC transporter permease [Chloroflexi bacterium]|nr:ABC transporter permease [Chloroflexota bacterium]